MDVLTAAATLLTGALIQGFFGFGFGILAMAGLTLGSDLVHAAGVVNLTGLLLTGGMAWDLRRSILWPSVRRIAPGILVGVVLGVSALRAFDGALMVRVLGLAIIAVAAWNLFTPSLRARDSRPLDFAVGLLGGTLNGAFNAGGPPVVAHLYRRPENPEALKATVQALFTAMSLVRFPVASFQGLIDAAVLRDAALAVPLLLAGVWLGTRLARRVDPERFRQACWVAFAVLGAVLLLS